MVAFGEQQLDHRAADLPQLRGFGLDVHAFSGGRHAGSLQVGIALAFRSAHLHKAEPACSHSREPIELAEGGDVKAVLARGFQQRCARSHSHIAVVDPQGDDAHGLTSAGPSRAR